MQVGAEGIEDEFEDSRRSPQAEMARMKQSR